METITAVLLGLPAAVSPTHPTLGIDKITAAINGRKIPLAGVRLLVEPT
jgi:hypothetical protein